MARYRATVPSRHSTAQTFAYLATFSNAVSWDPGVLTGEQLDPGPVGPGTRFRLVVPFLGLRMPLTYQVTHYQPGREVVLAASNGLLRATDQIVVTESRDGSAVCYAAEVCLRGPLRVLDLLLRPGFRAIGDRAATGLAQALSGGPAGGITAPPGTAVPEQVTRLPGAAP
jgi:polyketide cyclase/dehydrase/lipid transport protein